MALMNGGCLCGAVPFVIDGPVGDKGDYYDIADGWPQESGEND
jgi:hypothetical protein